MGSLYLLTRSSAIAELTAAVYVDYVSLVRILYNKYVGPPYCRTEKNAGRVTCCHLVSHGEYANGTDKQTDGRQTVTLRFPLNLYSVIINRIQLAVTCYRERPNCLSPACPFVNPALVFSGSPVDVVDDAGLQQKVTAGHQVVHDEVLIRSHRHRVANTQGTEHIQHLKQPQQPIRK